MNTESSKVSKSSKSNKLTKKSGMMQSREFTGGMQSSNMNTNAIQSVANDRHYFHPANDNGPPHFEHINQ